MNSDECICSSCDCKSIKSCDKYCECEECGPRLTLGEEK